MKFSINDCEWIILEKKQNEIQETMKNEENYYFGVTFRNTHEIWLDKDLCLSRKKQTLKHELMHCYISSYITLEEMNFTEEVLCDISSNAHDFIHKTIESYFLNVNTN